MSVTDPTPRKNQRRGRPRGKGLAALAWLLGCAMAGAADPAGVELGVSRVALFSSGVGYFECDTQIEGTGDATLNFRTEQINDILKSLVVQDFDGGKIGIVSYSSRDPIEKTLRSFGVDITGKPSLGQLLDQLRGEPVELTGTRKLRGVIVGVESRTVSVGDGKTVETKLLNLLTDNGLQQLDLANVDGLKLINESVNNELKKALATLALGHDADKKSVTISFTGEGKRRIRAAYLLEAPLWKTSYRLVLPAEKDKKPFLQGWATVENATEEDWKNVRLSLISGRPISFRMDLYEPIYVPRPLEKLEIYASLRPPELEGGFKDLANKAVAGGLAGRGQNFQVQEERAMGRRPGRNFGTALSSPAAAPPTASPASDGEGAMDSFDIGSEGVESIAAAQEAGELFEYLIQAPVTLARQHSAMLPIVNEEVSGEKISIFNPATHPKHPLNGLELTNATKLNLMQGPVTLFDGNVYAGDAKLPDMKPGEKRLLAYALDLAAEVLIKQQPQPEELVSVRIAKGTFIRRFKYLDTREYEIKNKADKEKTIILEQPYSDVWKLIQPKELYERTASLLRFKSTAPAGQTVKQVVQLERTGDTTVALSNLALDEIQIYMRSKSVSTKVAEALGKVAELRIKLDEQTRGRQQLETRLKETGDEQARVRQNVGTLPSGSDAYKRQVAKIDSLETELERFRADLVSIRAAEEQARKALEQYLLALDVE